MERFKLSDQFVNQYKDTKVDWGFQGLGYFIFKNTYARNITDDTGKTIRTEQWFETVRRCVEGAYSYQKIHCRNLGLPYDNMKAQRSAKKMYQKIFNFKFTPPGRGLWMSGTQYVYKHGSAAMNNCAFVSTQHIDQKNTLPFEWVFNYLMLGIGCSFDVLGADKILIKQPQEVNSWTKEVVMFKVPDSRQGWVEALKWKLKAYFDGKPMPQFDYSLIRQKGEPIKGFGGISSGYEPLESLLNIIDEILKPMIGKKISISNIVDIMNHIAKTVVAGNVRRSAQLALGDIDSEEYINLKNPQLNQDKLLSHRWASNNSVYAYAGQTDYKKIIPNLLKNGQPGIVWIDNCRNYSRMGNGVDYSDTNVMGVNPCVTGDTLVHTKEYGQIRMDRLVWFYNNGYKVNVLSRNLDSNKNEYKPVIFGALTRKDTPVVTLVLNNNIALKITPDHKVWCVNRNDYVIAQRLTPDDYVLLSDQQVVKVATLMQFGNSDVFDITVQDNHNFYGNSILIHNCAQIPLQSYELCNLVQVYPSKHESVEQFLETLKYAYLYAKSVTLVNTQSAQTNAVMLKNRRIGVSLTGIIDAFVKFGRRNFLEHWCAVGYTKIKEYDKKYSDWLCIPKSIKTTTVKPSGTCSILAGVSSGVHYPHSQYYIRRIRLQKESEYLDILRDAGYHIQPDVYNPDSTFVVQFPVKTQNFSKGKKNVCMYEQLNNAADLQRYWSDNAVSVTVTVKQNQYDQIETALQIFQDKLKTVSFLPEDTSIYKQLPFEQISEQKYLQMKSKIKPNLNLVTISNGGKGQRFCNNDTCQI